jgi:hypothetical protein
LGAAPVFRKKQRSPILIALAVVGGLSLVGMGVLVIGVVLIVGVVRYNRSEAMRFQLKPGDFPKPPTRIERWQPFRDISPPVRPSSSPIASPIAGKDDDAFLAAVEKFVGKLEQVADQLSAVDDLESAAKMQSTMLGLQSELHSAQAGLLTRSLRVSTAAADRFRNEYQPRIDTANRRIQTETSRINHLVITEQSQRSRITPGWAKP